MAEPGNLGAIEERVTGLERAVGHISNSIDALGKEFRERQRFPWAAIWGGVSVLLVIVGMFGAIVIWGFNSYLSGMNSNFERFHEDFVKLSDSVVPRGEHEGHWEAQVTADANLQRQIDETRSLFGSTYSLGDAIDDLGRRLDRLEQLRLDQTKIAPTSPVQQ
jgi:hypothetical protein